MSEIHLEIRYKIPRVEELLYRFALIWSYRLAALLQNTQTIGPLKNSGKLRHLVLNITLTVLRIPKILHAIN